MPEIKKSSKVVCVDGGHLNLANYYPGGVVEAGKVYHVEGVNDTGGLFILGFPILKPIGKTESGIMYAPQAWGAKRFKLCGRVANTKPGGS